MPVFVSATASSLNDSPLNTSWVLLACLCAQWCGVCRDYRSRFEEVQAEFPEVRFIWVDVEDDADLVDPVEVENFPTLLIAVDGKPRFFGPLAPHRETLARLVRAHATANVGIALTDPDLQLVTERLARLAISVNT